MIRVRAHLGFLVWAPRPLIGVCAHPGFQMCASRPLIRVHTNWGLWACAPRQPGYWFGCPLTWASGVCWFCLSGVHSTGAEGAGVKEATAAAGEFSKQPLSASIFSFFSGNSSYSGPPGPYKHLASHTAQPGSLPRILQQTLQPRPGSSATMVSALVSGTLLSLCTLLTIWFFNVLYNFLSRIFIYAGIPLPVHSSSDQLGVSLVLRESGLGSNLSHRHLLPTPNRYGF